MSGKTSFLKELYADRTKPANVTRISFRKKGYIEVDTEGYIHWISVRHSQRGNGWGDRLIEYAKKLYGDTLHSHAVSEAGDRLLAKHGVTILT